MRDLFARALSGLNDTHRPIRIVFGGDQANPLQGLMLVQYIDVLERMNEGLSGHVTCVSTQHHLPLQAFEGVPVEIQLVTDRGELRAIRAIVMRALRGQSDGALTLFQFTLGDPMALLRKRVAPTCATTRASSR